MREFAREARATPFATLLAAYFALLYRHSGQDDIVIGATTSGRESAEQDDGVGLWASTVALRCELDGEMSFLELVGRVRETVLWAIAHQHAPFEQIVARLGLERDLSRHPLFQVFVAHVPLVSTPLPGARPYDARPRTSRFDITLFFEEEPDDAFELAWECSTDLFDRDTIDALADRYVRLLEAALAMPEHALDDLPLLEEAEAAAALDIGRRRLEDCPVACMHERFERHAAAAPQAIALTLGAESLTYAELGARANRLAHHLRTLGVGPDSLVALFLAPSLELVVAILGVLKAGGAYLPLDPEYPSDRIEFVLGDADPAVVVTHAAVRDRLDASGRTVVCLDRDRDQLDVQPATNPPALAGPENLAYVIYTSGSTGRPKGVLVEHRHVARLLSAT
ncbi:MAG TPA: AMP-binding protein, partial [Acidimicrobiales bacterium]|nr:AMP-binding protein [Acidimicrobiales bacterium]